MSEALERFQEGLNEVLFLEFRERCKYLLEKRIPDIAVLHECSNPENKFAGGKKDSGPPNCFLEACPLFKSPLDVDLERTGYQQLYDLFCGELEGRT